MDRLNYRKLVAPLLAALLWSALFAALCHAQTGGFIWSERSSPQPHGEFMYLWNATGSQINAGTVVMSDSSSATTVPQVPFGKGFSTWDGNVSNVKRIVGVLITDTAGYMPAKVLVYGWTNYVKMAATGIAAGSYLRPSLTTSGTLTAWATTDSTNTFKPIVGQFSRYETTTSLYGYAKVDFRSVASGAK